MNDRNSTSPGVARQLVTFSCFAKEKVTKKKATPVCRRFAVPSIRRKRAVGLGEHCLSTWPRSGSCELRSPARLRLIEAAHRGLKAKSKTGWATSCPHIEVGRQNNSFPVHFTSGCRSRCKVSSKKADGRDRQQAAKRRPSNDYWAS